MDDDSSFLEQAKIFLEKEGDRLDIETAVSAGEGLELLDGENYDAIVSDYQMPGMDGLEFLKTVREDRESDIPFIIFTGKGREEVTIEALNLGADRYLEKGGDPKAQYGVLADAIVQEVEHSKAEEELRETKRNYQELFEKAGDAFFVHDSETGEILDVNERMCEMYGYSPEEIVGKTVEETSSGEEPYTLERAEELIQKAKEEGPQRFEWHAEKKSGKRFWVEVTLKEAKIGGKSRVLASVRDIIERKEAEEKLRESEKKLSAIYESSPISVTLSSYENGRYVNVNEAFSELTGGKKEEVVGKTPFEIGIYAEPAKKQHRELIEELEEKGSVRGKEMRFKDKNGNVVVGLLSADIVQIGGKKYMLSNVVDITEQKKAEEVARKEERRYEELFEGANELMITTDEEGYVKRVNKRVEEYSGYSEDELIGESILKIAHPDDEERYIEFWKRILDGERPVYELKGKAKDGSTKHIIARGRPIIENEEVVEVQYNAQDITKRKEAEERLEREKEKYEKLLKVANELIVTTDPEGYIKRMNRKAENITGYSEEEIIRENILKLAHEEDEEKFMEAWNRVLEGELEEIVVRIKTKGGDTRWLKVGGRPILEEGEVVEIQYTGQDITKLKETEARAKREKERFEELYEGANEGIFTTDRDGYVKRVNERTEELTGYTEEEYEGESVLIAAHPDDEDKFIEFWKRILDGEEPTYQLRIVTKDGETLHVVAGGRAIREDGEVAEIQYNFKDITKRVKSEEREEFLHSLLRHDLRNKISIIDGYHDLLQDTNLSDEQEKFVQKARKATRSSGDLIEKVRTLRKIEDEEVEEVDLEPLIQGAVDNCKPASPGVDFQIEMECPVEGCMVEAGSLLKTVFSNLLGNSARHSGGSKVRISNESTNGEMVCIIEDDGKGIPDEKKEKIFEKGYRKGENAGSGFGMYLVKEIANTYGGSVEVRDSDLGGARFDVHLQKV